MNWRSSLLAGVCALAGTVSLWGQEGRNARPDALSLRTHKANSARVQALPGSPESLRVTFEPADWPSVKFPAPRGQAWDWKSHGFLLLKLRNLEAQPVDLGIRIDDDPLTDGSRHCRTAQVKLSPRESATIAIGLTHSDPMAVGMRGLPALPGTKSAVAGGSGPFNLAHIVAFQVFMHEPKSAKGIEIDSASLAPPVSLNGIVDALGQYAAASWPGKVNSESELIDRHDAERRDLEAHPAPADRDRFGGWKSGPKQPAAGFFRTVKRDGRWWLVDPDGALFLSLGIDVVSTHESTMVTGRESMFSALPGEGDPLAHHFGEAGQIHSGPVRNGKTFNFYAANLQRVYGPEYLARWKETTLKRLPSWGFNTIGNWSDQRLYRNGQIPYVATVHIQGGHATVGSGSDYWGKMHDPFDPKFAESVRRSVRGVAARIKGDPWCLGTFVDNELSWGGFGDEGGRHGLALGALRLPAASSPAKRAILDQLKGKYGDIAKLNAAWKTSLADWQALEAPWQPASEKSTGTDAFKADLRQFVKELARAYFRTVRDELKAVDPDHLYLGCRFAWRTEEAIAASTEFCDVVSFNIYERRVDPQKWGFLTTLDRPVIIGEFHVGALDRGMFHTGLVSAADQNERAAIYADYVGSVLDNPALVGCHWFQYIDEPLTGRSFDGENYNIGFLTVTDTPYPEMVASARKIHREAYSRRAGDQAAR